MTRKIIDYGVASGKSHDEIKAQVKMDMLMGFEPIGGISIIETKNKYGKTTFVFSQSMVKYAN